MDYLPALHTPEAYQRLPLNTHVCGTTTFLWEGLRLLSERRQGIEMLYVYEDSDSYSPLARIDHENGKKSVYYFRCQPNGLPDTLDDSEGNPQWYARFTSWGKTEVESGRLHTPGHKYSQNLRFQGQYLDRETGLHYNTFRYYDPDTGRFTQHDPIGLAGGLNLYQYAPNALVWVDPWGWISAPSTLPDIPGIYIITAGNDSYVGSSGIGKQGMNGRIGDINHKNAQALLGRKGVKVQFIPVDLGKAITESDRNNILRYFEQREYDKQVANKKNMLNDKTKRIQAIDKKGHAENLIKKHGASAGKRRRTCK